MKIFSGILKSVIDFLLPQNCLACNTETAQGFICHDCLDLIPYINPPICQVCGRPIARGKKCHFCKKDRYFDHGRAWTRFLPPVDKIIHFFKYRRMTKLASLVGTGMASVIKADFYLKDAQLIVPVPLFWWKKLRRGYNQAQILADVISQECGIETKNVLRRTKNTKSQTKLSEAARRENVSNAFSLRENSVKDKIILLVDDVLTTGATINECARVLKEAGAKAVYSCVAAITPG